MSTTPANALKFTAYLETEEYHEGAFAFFRLRHLGSWTRDVLPCCRPPERVKAPPSRRSSNTYPQRAVIEDILVATAARTQNVYVVERLERLQQPDCEFHQHKGKNVARNK